MTVVDAESRFHVLAVDDSLIDRKLIEMLLKTSSYQGECEALGRSMFDCFLISFEFSLFAGGGAVTTVDSGSKALEVLGLRDESDDSSPPSSSSPDHQERGVSLIITDYCMPGMTGYDLLKRVKGSSSLKDIPVVIMSSENVPARINRCLEDGAEEFFLKPVKLADMKKLKSHLLKRKQQPFAPQPDQQLEKPPHNPEDEEAAAEAKPDGIISDCNCCGSNRTFNATSLPACLPASLRVTELRLPACLPESPPVQPFSTPPPPALSSAASAPGRRPRLRARPAPARLLSRARASPLADLYVASGPPRLPAVRWSPCFEPQACPEPGSATS
ncbi:hypothetical protein ABZP36_015416 [Zizania latifolia]